MQELARRLREARGGTCRRAIADRAARIDGAPETVTWERLRLLEEFLSTPPQNGAELRAFTAAAGVDWLEALDLLGYWPPMKSAYVKPAPQRLLEEACRLAGWRMVRGGDGKIIIHTARMG